MIFIRRLSRPLYSYRQIVYIVAIILTAITYLFFRSALFCTNLEAWHHVRQVCDSYQKRKAIGTLCESLCITKDIHSVTCHTFGSTKEAVFSGQWHDARLVFKAASSEVQSLHWYDNGMLKYPTEKEFLATVRAIVKTKLNVTLSDWNIIKLSHARPSHRESDEEKRRIEMDNLWMLLHDSEYLITAVYPEKDIFPQLLGTCGAYYAVEYLQPVNVVPSFLTITDSREDWGRKLKIAVLIMELLEELESNFHEPFHLCDIKLDHFGLTHDLTRVKFVDLDGVYPRSVINKIIRKTKSCTVDDDCEYLDCRAKCSDNKCANGISNNNLQIVCEKIFLGWRMSNRVIIPGLLMSQHTPAELATILRQCSNPEGDSGKARASPTDDVKKRLYSVLIEMEQAVNNDVYL